MSKNDDSILLKNQLCFPIYVCSREIIRLYKPLLDDLDLTYTQYITMMAMWEHKEMSVRELGQCLYLDSGTLTPLLKKLETKGYINRSRSKKDERVLIVSITPEGEKLKSKARCIPNEMKKCLALTDEEKRTLSGILTKIINTNT